MPAMVMPTNFGSGTTPANPSTYTLGTRPAASSMPNDTIWVSDINKHQLSDGANWLVYDTDRLKATGQVPAYTLATRPTAAIAGANTVVKITDLAGGTYQVSDGTTWSSLGADIISAVKAYIGVRGSKGLPHATYAVRRAVASTVYIDPTGGAGSGTFVSPLNALPGTLAANTAYLFKAGTSAGGFTVGQNGGASTPIVIGVYNATTGARIADRTVGRVTITGQIDINGRSWVSLEHLSVTGGDPRITADGSTSCQVICCRTNTNTAGSGIKAYWSGGQTGAIEVDGCEANGNANGVTLDAAGGADITIGSVIQFCTTSDNLGNGIQWGGGRRWHGCHIADCYGRNNSTATNSNNDNNNGIKITGILRLGSSVRWNDFSGSTYACIWLQPDGGSWHAYDCAGLVVQNNVLSYAQYCIAIFSKCNGTYLSPVYVEYNELSSAGTRDGSTVAQTAERWGRAIEIFANYPDAIHQPQYIVVRWNSVHDTTMWDRYGTDAQGIGLDDNTRLITVYGNLVYNCAGQAVQSFTTTAARVFGNVTVGNMTQTALGWQPLPQEISQYRAELAMGDTLDNLYYGNAVICRRTGTTRYGIVGGSGNGGQKTQVHNNLVQNAEVCGVVINTAWADVDYNFYVNNAQNKLTMAGTNGEGASIALTGNEGSATVAGSTDPYAQAELSSAAIFGMLPVSPYVPGGGGGGTGTGSAPAVTLGATNKTPTGGAATNLTLATVAGNNGDVRGAIVAVHDVTTGGTAPSVDVPTGWSGFGPFTHSAAKGVVYVFTRALTTGTAADTVSLNFGGSAVAVGVAFNVADAQLDGSIVQTERPTWSAAGIAPLIGVSTADSLWMPVIVSTDSPRTATVPGGINPGPQVYADNGVTGVGLFIGTASAQTPSIGPSGDWTMADPYGGSGFERPIELSIVWKPVTPSGGSGGGGGSAPVITTPTALGQGTSGVAGSWFLAASGSTPITWTLIAGALPPGLSLSTGTGALSGTPTTPGFYTFTIRAANGTGSDTRTFSQQIVAAGTVAVPTSLAVTAVSSTSLRLSWVDPSSGETGFAARVKAAPGGAALSTVTTAANATSAVFSDLLPGTTYWLDVQTLTEGGASAWSSEASGTTSSVVVYVPPVAQIGPQVMLRWSNDGGRTWSNEVWASAGRVGEYRTRARWRRLGRGRDRVYEITVSDAIKIVILGAAMKATDGDA